MRFLLKIVMFGFVGLMLLPAFAPSEYRAPGEDADAPPVPSPLEFAAMIGSAAADLRNICTRQPDICETGGEFVSYAGSKAREGLVIAYAMFRHGPSETATGTPTPLPPEPVPTK